MDKRAVNKKTRSKIPKPIMITLIIMALLALLSLISGAFGSSSESPGNNATGPGNVNGSGKISIDSNTTLWSNGSNLQTINNEQYIMSYNTSGEYLEIKFNEISIEEFMEDLANERIQISFDIISLSSYAIPDMTVSLNGRDIPEEFKRVANLSLTSTDKDVYQITSSAGTEYEHAFDEVSRTGSDSITLVISKSSDKSVLRIGFIEFGVNGSKHTALCEIEEDEFYLNSLKIEFNSPKLSAFKIDNVNVSKVLYRELTSGSYTYKLVDDEYYFVSGYTGEETELVIPETVNGVTVAGIFDYALADKPITSVSLPATIKVIGDSAFKNCTSLTTVNLPSSVTIIEDCAFSGCQALNIDMVIPEGVERINNYVFNNCFSLKNIMLPSTIEYIGIRSFNNCIAFESVVIPSGVSEIMSEAFRGCTALKELTLPSSLRYVNFGAFDYCNSVETVYYEGDMEAFKAILALPGNIINANVIYDYVYPVEETT